MNKIRSKYWLALLLAFVGVFITVSLIIYFSTQKTSPTEVVSLRNYTSKTTESSDGTMTTTFYQNPIHYKNSKGEFEDIDARIKKSTLDGYRYENTANVVKSYFKESSEGDFIKLETEGSTLYYSLAEIPGLGSPKKVSAVASDSQIVYPNVYDGIDIVYIVDVSQNKVFFRINTKDTALKIKEIPILVRTEGAQIEQDDQNQVFIKNEKGTIAKINKPFLVEERSLNSTEPVLDQDKRVDIDFKLETENQQDVAKPQYTLIKIIDDNAQNWLKQENRVYPILVDPVTVYYPDANVETTTVDGIVRRNAVDETWATIQAGAGTSASPSTTADKDAFLQASEVTNQYQELRRGIYLFDTSSISSSANIISTAFSLYGTNKWNGLGAPTLVVVSSTPASNTDLVTGDFAQLGTTTLGSIAYASYSTTAYNDISILKSSLTVGGITKLGTRLEWDRSGSFTGVWKSNATGGYSGFRPAFADDTGIDTDPKLIVTWTYNKGSLWKFDEANGSTAYDTSDYGNNGTVTGADWTPADLCVSGSCLNFVSTSGDNVSVTAAASVNLTGSTGYTMCAWVKPLSDGEGDLGEIISKGSSYLRVEQESAGTVKVKALFDLATDATYTSTRTISTSDWSQVCASYTNDGDDEIDVYINGQLAGSSTDGVGDPADDSGSALIIGGDSSNNFDGFIDEVRIYPIGRSAAEIKTDFNGETKGQGSSAVLGGDISSGAFLSKGLVGYWKLDETSGNAVDSSGKAITLTDTNTVAFVGGKFANAGDFESTSSEYQYAADNASLSLTGDVTISAWIKPESVTAATLFDIAGKWDGANESYLLAQYGDEIRYYIDSSSNYVTTDSTNLAVGTWYHVTASYQASSATVRILVNGIAQAATITGTIPTSIGDDAGRFQIGAEDSTLGAANFYDGVIDDVRIYNWAFGGHEALELSEWAPGPVVQYKFDEGSGSNANDSSGNGSTGAITEATYVPGKFGTALDFDGSNDLVDANDVANADFTDGKNFTVEFWMNRRTYTTDDTVVAKKSDQLNSSAGWVIWVDDSTDDVRLVVSDGDSANLHTVDSTTAFTSAGWYHVAVVYDDSASTASKIYINGIDDSATNTATGTFASIGDLSNAVDFRVASESDGGEPFDGQIDDVRVYNYVRSAKQVVQDMNAGHPSVGTPVGSAAGYWRFDDADGTNANDATENNNDLTLSAESWVNTGKFGTAFNGTNATWASKADDPDFDFAAADSMTVSAWVRSDATGNPGAREYLVSKGAPGAAGYALYFEASNGYPVYAIDDDTSWTTPDFTATYSTDVYDNTWHHIVGVKDGTNNIKIYVDGALRATSASIAAEGTLANAGSLVFADSDAVNNGDEFTGDIDEAKIYRFALTAEEIKLEYNRGKAIVLGSQNTTSGSSTPDNSLDRQYCVPGDSTSCSGPVGEWKFDEGSGSSNNDSSGNGNTGTPNGDATWVPGKQGSAMTFDGTGDFVGIGDPSVLDFERTNAFTLEAWVKTTQTNGSSIIGKQDTSTAYKGYRLFWIDTSGQPRLWLSNNAAAGANLLGVYGSVQINDGAWHHVVASYDGSSTPGGIKFYVDGMINSNTTEYNTLSATILNNINLEIGRGGSGGQQNPYTGQIDSVRIYDYVRTPAQVAWDYNRGKPVAHYKLDECSGTVANDSSGNSLTGTVTIGASGTNTSAGSCSGAAAQAWYDGLSGKYNGSLEFDGTDDIVTIADSAKLNVGKSYTVSAWIYPTAWGAVGDSYIRSIYSDEVSGSGATFTLRLGDGTDAQKQRLGAFIYDGSNNNINSTTDLSLNTWYHVMMTYDGANVKLYINGRLDKTTAYTGTPTEDDNSWYIGRSYDGRFFTGQIDDVRIYKYPLTAVQVKTLYNENSAVRFAPASGQP